MSKRTRYSDNSKRRQPIQQQRAQAAQQVLSQRKSNKSGDTQETLQRSREQTER
jgi:hypothetical protein